MIHPAVEAVREAAERYPPRSKWPEIIEAIGDEPELERLITCLMVWKKRGFNPVNYAWATEWYVRGIPKARRRTHASTSENLSDYQTLFAEWDGDPEKAEAYLGGDRDVPHRPRLGDARPEGGSPLRPVVDEGTGPPRRQ